MPECVECGEEDDEVMAWVADVGMVCPECFWGEAGDEFEDEAESFFG